MGLADAELMVAVFSCQAGAPVAMHLQPSAVRHFRRAIFLAHFVVENSAPPPGMDRVRHAQARNRNRAGLEVLYSAIARIRSRGTVQVEPAGSAA